MPALDRQRSTSSRSRRGCARIVCGLKWHDIDLDASSVRVTRQLLRAGREPVFGTPKSKSARRTIEISSELAELLATHKKHQAEVKTANRMKCRDLGLVFAKPHGQPLQTNNLEQLEFAKLVELAEVKAITFHGLRHPSTTLALKAGTQPHVVSKRLGHKRIETTQNIYAHALPSMQKDAAPRWFVAAEMIPYFGLTIGGGET